MNFADYQKQARRTREGDCWLNMSLGLAGEAGEVCDLVKKSMYHGHEFDPNKLAEELGDVLWYVSNFADVLGLELEDIAKLNIDKLQRRYPNGFETIRSIRRQEE